MMYTLLLILLCSNPIQLNKMFVKGGIGTMIHYSWISDGGRFLKYIWDDCSMLTKPLHNDNNHKIINDTMYNNGGHNNYTKRIKSSTIDCLKRKSLIALDHALNADIIPLVDNIEMIRYNLKQHHQQLDDTSNNNLNMYRRGSSSWPEENIEDNSITEKHLNITDWKTSVIFRLADVFRTHVVKINLEKNDTFQFRSSDSSTARRRRHRHMMPIFMFGTIAMGMLLIPMGFKFLAVLGGKALLLAKMALLLASIQGLKRIATSGVNYGLYTQYPTGGWHERHASVELLNGSPTIPYTYDTAPIYDRGSQSGVQMSVGGR